ncbi:MAG: four helix bundle protein [Bacteroidota bacterium]
MATINQFNEHLRLRTMKMAMDVRQLLITVKVSSIDRPVVNQLIRSSSSVAANYRAANCARSDGEFLSKISIVLEESDESKFWLEYLSAVQVLKPIEVESVLKEVDELVRIFSSIRKKMKDRVEQARSSSPKSQVPSPKIRDLRLEA